MSHILQQCILTATGAALAIVISVAMHDTARADTATAAAPVEEGGLETITVTARKRTESVQDVPVDVTAVTGEQIRRQDLTSLEKLAEVTPDFNVGRASNGSAAQLTLRGIGSSSTSIGIEQSVAVVVDDVYYGQGRVIEEGFFDLGEVTILKGPQALFFGKNATAGVISLTSADPTNSAELYTKAAYEIESKTTQVEAVASGPLTDTLGVRVAVRGSIMDGGYYKNEADDVTYSTFDSATGRDDESCRGSRRVQLAGRARAFGTGDAQVDTDGSAHRHVEAVERLQLRQQLLLELRRLQLSDGLFGLESAVVLRK